MEVRRLTAADVGAYHALRLRGLVEHPEAFGASADEWRQRALEVISEQITAGGNDFCLYGAFVEGVLAGIASFGRPTNPKLRHRAGLYQMLVAPEFRRCGVGERLVAAIVAHARQQPELEELILAVTVGNDAAEALYRKIGFEASYIEPRHIKLGDRYYDNLWMIYRWKE